MARQIDFPRINTGDKDLRLIQDNISAALRSLQSQITGDGESISSLGTSPRTTEKILASNITANGAVTALGFNNLVVGNWYQLTYSLHFDPTGTGVDAQFTITHNGSTIQFFKLDQAGSTFVQPVFGQTKWFQATATTVVLTKSGSTSFNLVGTGGYDGSYGRIIELTVPLDNGSYF